MNCQEVMELMQRQLDDDLDESEKEVLTNHTRQCPDCAVMFERLQLLSAELTSLPKVMPGYSLVDAIMPQLERIELFDQHNPAPAATPAVNTTELASRREKRERRWPSIRMMSGVIAAGVVAGLFLVTYKHGALPDFSTGKFAANEANSDAADMASVERKEMSFKTNVEDSKAEALEKTGTIEEPTAMKNQTQSTENAAPTSGNSDSSTDNEGSSAAGQSDELGGDIAEGGGSNSSEGFIGQMDGTDYGVTAFDAAFMAPNSKYSALAEDFMIRIFAISDQSLVYTSPRKNGKLANLSWSEDSTKLTYEVQVENGAIEKYVIDLATLTEQKAEH